MNCSICTAYLREKNKCPGCRKPDDSKPVTRVICKIKTCENLQKGSARFCFECEQFPCNNLKHLDKRYRAKYNMSMIENLGDIKEKNMKEFLEAQEGKYECPKCGDVICVHNDKCYSCGYEQR